MFVPLHVIYHVSTLSLSLSLSPLLRFPFKPLLIGFLIYVRDLHFNGFPIYLRYLDMWIEITVGVRFF